MDKEKLLKKLKEIIPDKKRIVAHDIPEKYLSDTLGRLKGEAAALIFPQSTEEVSKILKYAHKHDILTRAKRRLPSAATSAPTQAVCVP